MFRFMNNDAGYGCTDLILFALSEDDVFEPRPWPGAKGAKLAKLTGWLGLALSPPINPGDPSQLCMRKRADSAFLQVPPLLIAVVRKWRAGTVGGIWQDQIGAKMGSALVTIYFC